MLLHEIVHIYALCLCTLNLIFNRILLNYTKMPITGIKSTIFAGRQQRCSNVKRSVVVQWLDAELCKLNLQA